MTDKQLKWYVGGLHFDCNQCGGCCSGPEEGFIWLTKHEISLIAEHLNISTAELHDKYLKRLGFRYSIIEDSASKDCIFLKETGGKKGCSIYSVRPNQCRTWPFWTSNLETPDHWNIAATGCPGINRDKLYDFKTIEKLRKSKNWWQDDK